MTHTPLGRLSATGQRDFVQFSRHVGARAALLAVLSLLLVGCFDTLETTEFPDGLEPLMEEVEQQSPPFSEGSWPETVLIQKGEKADYDWAQAVGFVLADLEDVYPALRTTEVMVDRAEVDRFSAMELDDPAYEHSFVIHNEVDDLVSVEFDITWRFGTIETDDDGRPTLVAVTFQKTFGTSFIDRLEGSILLSREADGVTRLTAVERIEATAGSPERIEGFLRTLFEDLVEVSHGRPVPVRN